MLPEIAPKSKQTHLFGESTIKDRRINKRMMINQSASPTIASSIDINSQLKLSRNRITNRRKTKENTPHRSRDYQSRNGMIKAAKSAKVTKKFLKLPYVRNRSVHDYAIDETVGSRDRNRISHNQSLIDGFTKHIHRLRDSKLIRNGNSLEVVERRSPKISKKTKRLKNKNNIKIINQNEAKIRKNRDDYLLQRRIDRENNPDKSFKRRHWWNNMMREELNELDYYVVSLKAKEKSRKALLKENLVLESFSEKERIDHNKEVDQMLIDSLQAKIKLINGLTSSK
jgi:hypothetical protein